MICFDDNFLIFLYKNMYQLNQRKLSKLDGLLGDNHDVIVHNNQRSCTDIIVLIIFLLFAGTFIGLLIYSLVEGSPNNVFAAYNAEQIRCRGTRQFQYGYFTKLGSIDNAICVSQCPSQMNQVMNCLVDDVNCLVGTYNSTYAALGFEYFCMPTLNLDDVGLNNFLSYNIYSLWAFNLKQGWPILVVAAICSMAASLLFLLIINCCTGIIIWLFITIACGGCLGVGILFILQGKGIYISQFLSQNLSVLSVNSLLWIGSILIVIGVLLLLLCICLRKRIQLGAKAVELAAIFIFENCCMILLPISQAIFVVSIIAAIIIGGVCLCSMGTLTFPNNSGFPVITFDTGLIVVISIFLAGGIWVMFYFHGCNHFMICSAIAVWYYNHQSQFEIGSPFGDSLYRLVRFNTGSVAFTSLINGFLFLLRIIAHIFAFKATEGDHSIVAFCLKCLNCIFCLLNCILRLLNDGTYVMIGITGKGYCRSTFKAFGLISGNPLKFSITDGISIFFTTLGILGISVGITIAAYIACIKISYFASLLTSPLIVTMACFLISLIISAIYLSMIDISALSIMQCYLYEHDLFKGQMKYVKPKVQQALAVQNVQE